MTKLRILSMVGLALALAGAAVSAEHGAGPTADEALRKLLEGNKRYAAEAAVNPDHDAACRTRVAKGQAPFAIVLGCSDSRVAPEVLFDQGMGDLFVVRTAGQVADDVALGSIEYAAEHLGAPLVVVLGHERCGAVKATADGGEAPGHIEALVKAIRPSVEKVKGKEGDLAENAMVANVEATVEQLKASKPILAKLVEEGKLKVVGARYDLDTGEVTLLP